MYAHTESWNEIAWFQQDWVPVVGCTILTAAFVIATIWFVHGIIKYGSRWDEDKDEEIEENDGDVY